MDKAKHVYGKVDSEADMKERFSDIRKDVDHANSKPALTELYKRAGYLITLTHAPSWKEKLGRDASALREIGKDEFRKTAKEINHRAKQIGIDSDYDETWGK